MGLQIYRPIVPNFGKNSTAVPQGHGSFKSFEIAL